MLSSPSSAAVFAPLPLVLLQMLGPRACCDCFIRRLRTAHAVSCLAAGADGCTKRTACGGVASGFFECCRSKFLSRGEVKWLLAPPSPGSEMAWLDSAVGKG